MLDTGSSDGGELPVLSSGCATQITACTASNGEADTLTVVNSSSNTVELHWVDAACALLPYQTIAPGASADQPTYDDHVWALVASNTGTELGRVQSTAPDVCTVEVQ